MKSIHKESGFASWELLLVIVVLAAAVFVGYHVYTADKTVPAAPSSQTAAATAASPAATATPAAPVINDTADLDKAAAALDQVDVSGSNADDSSQLDSSTSSF